MKDFKWKILLWKTYFDQGFGVTNYFKYLIAFFGVATLDVKATFILAMIYGLSCFLVGRAWFKYRLVDIEVEIRNRFNPFVNDVRGKMKIKQDNRHTEKLK